MSYGGNTDRGPFLNAIVWILNSIALISVCLRILSRNLNENQNGLDDAFIGLAMSVSLARAIYVSICVSWGLGRHLVPLLKQSPIHTTGLLRLLVILQAIGLWTWALPKLAVVALLVRVFVPQRRTIILLWVAASLLIVLVFIVTITTFQQCTPVAFQWDPEIQGGYCWKPSINLDLGYVAGAYSAFVDCAFAVYPIVQVSKLQMERSRKIVVGVSLSLGFIACIVTIYKLSIITEIVDTQDPTWATIPLEVWNSVESCVLIVAASIPMSRPVLRIIGQGFRELSSRITDSLLSASRGSSTRLQSPSDVEQSKTSNKVSLSGSSRQRLPLSKKSNDDIQLLQDRRLSGSGHELRLDSEHEHDESAIYVTTKIGVSSQPQV